MFVVADVHSSKLQGQSIPQFSSLFLCDADGKSGLLLLFTTLKEVTVCMTLPRVYGLKSVAIIFFPSFALLNLC